VITRGVSDDAFDQLSVVERRLAELRDGS